MCKLVSVCAYTIIVMSTRMPTSPFKLHKLICCYPPYQVNCRDCHKESETNFHVIGFKCSECGSYNTVRCGNEEIPPDPQPRQGGLVGLIRRLAARGNQRQGDEESGAFMIIPCLSCTLSLVIVLVDVRSCIANQLV